MEVCPLCPFFSVVYFLQSLSRRRHLDADQRRCRDGGTRATDPASSPCGHGQKCENLSHNGILPALLAKTGKRWRRPVKRRQRIPNPAEARAWTINLNSFQNGATAAAALQHAFVAVAVTPSTPAPKPRPAVSFKSQTLPFIVNQAKARTSVWLSEREPAVLKSTLRCNGSVRDQNRAVGPADAKSLHLSTRNIEV